MPLYIREEEVAALLSMRTAMSLVQEAFDQLGRGTASNQPRRRVRGAGGTLHVMFAAQPEAGVMAVKSYTTSAAGARFHVLLYDAAAGDLLAVIEANRLGQIRTGAATGVATQFLAREDAQIAAVIGTGFQARTQVEAVCLARRMTEVRCYGRDEERRRRFAEEMSACLGVWVLPAAQAEDAVRGADIVITATTSRTPVVHSDWIGDGAHVNAVGSNSLLKAELDDRTLERASLIAVDALECVPLECGDFLSALEKGILCRERIREIGPIVAGISPGRTAASQLTLFKSHGLAVEDAAVAAHVYRSAVEKGLGSPIG